MAELYALLLAVLCVTSPAYAETPPFGSAQLTVQGSRLTVYGDSQTVDWDQTVNVGEAIRIRTCYGSSGTDCGSASALDPSIAGLEVLGELSGPELPQPLPFETLPGGSFFLPGFQKEGDYVLSNIRLVESATARVLGTGTPSAATIHVRQILLASATVTRLSLADLQARGITITQESFQAFSTVATLSMAPQDELGWFSKAIGFLTTPFKRCGISGWQPTGCDAKAAGTAVYDAGHSTDGFFTIDLRLETFVIQTVSMPPGVERYVRIEVEPKTGAHAVCERLGGVLKGQHVFCGGPVAVDTDGKGFLEMHPGDDFEVA